MGKQALALSGFVLVLMVGCSQPQPPQAITNLRIVVTERSAQGARLVFLAPSGRRVGELTQTLKTASIDTNPAWSPDGRFVVFASSRGRSSPAKTSLWMVAPFIANGLNGQQPVPLAVGTKTSRERDPRWLSSSRAIVFSSDQGGSLDLYRVGLREVDGMLVPSARPVQLSQDAADNLSPSISPDGEHIAFMSIATESNANKTRGDSSHTKRGGQGRSTIRMLSLRTHEIISLTQGPVDVTPAFNPQNQFQLAYASRAQGRADMDIMLIDIRTGKQLPLPGEPLADLTGPVWSIDGRHLFATAVFRSVASGNAILSSIVVIDRMAVKPIWRALHDPAYTESRIGVALAPRVFLPSELRVNLPYKEALKLAIEQHLIREQEDLRDQALGDR